MNENFNSLRLGNVAFNEGEYADAIRSYTVSSNSNLKSTKSDSYLNRALAHKMLGLTQHSRNDFSEAVNSPYKNILIESIEKKVLQPDEKEQTTKNDSSNKSNFGNLFQQFHSNNSYIHKHYVYNNHKKIKKESKEYLNSKPPLSDCFSNTDFFLECSRIQDMKDQSSYQFASSYKRRTEINKINDFISTIQDVQSGVALGSKNPNYWLFKAKASFTLRQLETALECVHFFGQRTQQSTIKNEANQNPSLNSSTVATINALKNLYSEKPADASQVYPNFCIPFQNRENMENNNNRLFRIALNLTCGRISEVLYDDPTHPLSLFATRGLPIKVEDIILNRSPFLGDLLSAMRETLQYPGTKLYKVLKPDLGIDIAVQQKWYQNVKEVPRLILQLFPQISSISHQADVYEPVSEKSPENLSPNRSDKVKSKRSITRDLTSRLLHEGIIIGRRVSPERSSNRDSALSGLAALELSQLITSYSLRKNTSVSGVPSDDIFPTFELSVSIVSSWLRFSYPIFPIFPKYDIPHSSEKVELVCSGAPQNQVQFESFAPRFAQRVIEALVAKKTVADAISQFGGIQIDPKRPETILCFTKTPVNVVLEPSKARIYLRPQHFGTYDFGIVIGEDDAAAARRKFEELANSWNSLINEGTKQTFSNLGKVADLNELINGDSEDAANLLKSIFRFWFDWNLAQPLLAFSTAAGQIIFAALMHAFFGLAVDGGMPVDYDLTLEAFLARNDVEFRNKMMKDLNMNFVGNDNQNVIKTLPDMNYRTAILLDVPDNDLK